MKIALYKFQLFLIIIIFIISIIAVTIPAEQVVRNAPDRSAMEGYN